MTSAPVTAPLLPWSAPLLLVLLVSLAVALVAGFLMHRSDYCLTGMVRDLFLFRRAGLLPVLLLQIGATMLLLELARLGGLWSGAAFITVKPLLLTSLIGGALFGFGSVLCGSCVVGCLYKMATGSLLNFVAFLAMVAGARPCTPKSLPGGKGLRPAGRICLTKPCPSCCNGLSPAWSGRCWFY